jgi:ATPase subunit of ABC transporter with duplicated ATPase domains
LAQEERQQAALRRTIEHELEFIRSGGGAKGGQGKSGGRARERRYEELVDKAKAYVKDTQVDAITIPVGPRLGGKVLEARGLTKAFNGRLLIDGLDLSVPPGAVVGVVGGNGAGKSTLFKMIMGLEAPDAGTLELGDTVVPMYVDQSRDGLDPSASVRCFLVFWGWVFGGFCVSARARVFVLLIALSSVYPRPP